MLNESLVGVKTKPDFQRTQNTRLRLNCTSTKRAEKQKRKNTDKMISLQLSTERDSRTLQVCAGDLRCLAADYQSVEMLAAQRMRL